MLRVERLPLNERVYQQLRDVLARGQLKPNSRLDEEELAADLGVSRTPIREAIGKLTTEGFAQYRPYQGSFVRSFTAKQVDDLYRVRQALEALAVRQTVSTLTDAQLAQLRAILADVADALAAGDMAAYGAADRRFHRAIAAWSGNQTLIESLDRLDVQVQIVRTVANHDPGGVARTADERPRILAAMAARDTEQAVTLLTEHIDGVRRIVVAQLIEAEAQACQPGTSSPG